MSGSDSESDFKQEIGYLNLPKVAEARENAEDADRGRILVILGASGDLARKSLYPALWSLFKHGLLPSNTFIIGYGRSKITLRTIMDKAFSSIEQNHAKFLRFFKINFYEHGDYQDSKKAELLSLRLLSIGDHFQKIGLSQQDRTFYLALPPFVYAGASQLIAQAWRSPGGRTFVALEKPFGTDLTSFEDLQAHLDRLFKVDEVGKVDHYLWLEMMSVIPLLRLANPALGRTWSNEAISGVLISFKESFGTFGRAGYFDSAGIIRDVMQNHLLQILCAIAMEPVKGCDCDLSDERAKLLSAVKVVPLEDVILGQYVGNSDLVDKLSQLGYTDDPKVSNQSLTPTFATIVFYIDTPRWEGVPFIMRAGKAMDESLDEVRIQFREGGTSIQDRNELIVQLKPEPKLSLRLNLKEPILRGRPTRADLSLTWTDHFRQDRFPSPYERLFANLLAPDGVDQSRFVGTEELRQSWEIFTPLLESIHTLRPIPYVFGSRGPPEANELIQSHGFELND